jgi:regulatory protein SWI6
MWVSHPRHISEFRSHACSRDNASNRRLITPKHVRAQARTRRRWRDRHPQHTTRRAECRCQLQHRAFTTQSTHLSRSTNAWLEASLSCAGAPTLSSTQHRYSRLLGLTRGAVQRFWRRRFCRANTRLCRAAMANIRAHGWCCSASFCNVFTPVDAPFYLHRIPLERGRDVAIQFGVAPLLAPLFDFMPTPASVGTMPPQARTSQSQSAYMPSHATTHPYYAPYAPRPAAHYPQNQLYPYTPTGHQATQPPLYAPVYHAPAPLSAQNTLAPPVNIRSPPRAAGQITQPQEPLEHAQPASSDASVPTGAPAANSAAGQKRPRPEENPLGSPRSIYSNTNQTIGDGTDDRRNGSPSKRARTGGDKTPGQSPTLAPAPAFRPSSATAPQLPAIVPNGVANAAADVDLNWRYHTKPPQVSLSDRLSPLKSAKHRTILLSTINESDPSQVIVALTPQGTGAEKEGTPLPEIDLIVDDQGHTPLHWAAALARLGLVEVLINHGADTHRGNYSGETPLIRSILSVHAFEQQCFPALLQLLSASIRTVDSSSRSVLHHIGHVAGIKSRGPSARYYMESVLEFVARNQKGDFKSLVDLQDVHGDTALNVAARVGNRSLVRMLVDVGANKSLANKLGLAPGDFGVEGEVGGTNVGSAYLPNTLVPESVCAFC